MTGLDFDRDFLEEFLRTEQGAEPVAIVDIIIIEVGTSVIARYPRIIVVVLLRKPMSAYFQNPENHRKKIA